jgi:spore coat polysaccharide biosynthesis protein SpsF
MRRVIVIQARMTSTRLPGKVLMELDGRTVIEQQLARLQRCRQADEIVWAVTTNAADDPLVALAERLGVRWYRGSEDDVLSRYLGAAREAAADLVVRVTSDCPLIDAGEVDAVIEGLTPEDDYAANFLERRLPRGLETEALWRDTLERTARMATSKPAREHVTFFIHVERPDLFERRAIVRPYDAGELRWTVDTADDLELVRRIYRDLDLGATQLGFADILAHVREHPELAAINAHIEQKRI